MEINKTFLLFTQGSLTMVCLNEVKYLDDNCAGTNVDLTTIPTPPPQSLSGSFLILCFRINPCSLISAVTRFLSDFSQVSVIKAISA